MRDAALISRCVHAAPRLIRRGVELRLRRALSQHTGRGEFAPPRARFTRRALECGPGSHHVPTPRVDNCLPATRGPIPHHRDPRASRPRLGPPASPLQPRGHPDQRLPRTSQRPAHEIAEQFARSSPKHARRNGDTTPGTGPHSRVRGHGKRHTRAPSAHISASRPRFVEQLERSSTKRARHNRDPTRSNHPRVQGRPAAHPSAPRTSQPRAHIPASRARNSRTIRTRRNKTRAARNGDVPGNARAYGLGPPRGGAPERPAHISGSREPGLPGW